MKKHHMPDMKEGGVNVTPLIDIIMCLIIFFMLVAKIGITSGADPKIVPPATLLGSKIEDMGNTITLNVRDPVKVEQERAEEAGDTPTPLPEIVKDHPRVTAMVEMGEDPKPLAIITPSGDRELRRVLSALVQNNPKLRVIILADRDLRYQLMEQILIECAMAKVKDFNFQTKPGI